MGAESCRTKLNLNVDWQDISRVELGLTTKQLNGAKPAAWVAFLNAQFWPLAAIHIARFKIFPDGIRHQVPH